MLRTIASTSTACWQDQLADLVTSPQELLEHLGLDAAAVGLSEQAIADFPLRVPRPYLARMRPGDPTDPLLLQVLPQRRETHETPGFVADPLAESGANTRPGLLHKYQGRVLLITTQSCAIHCRYCFRRHFPYGDNRPGRAEWRDTLEHIVADTSISEVILSGGDPLATSNSYLGWLLEELANIEHVRRLRLHTRLPIMLPARVDAPLAHMLERWRGRAVVVLHSNHARELDAETDAACARLREAGAHLLNQSVLLKGINDDARTLRELSERLFAAGVLPYYLHMLDRVKGAAHFETGEAEARRIMARLRAELPGYLVPKLVRELPAEPCKTPL